MICSLIDAGLKPEEIADLDPLRTRLLYFHPRDEQGHLKLPEDVLPGTVKEGEGKSFKERFWIKRQRQGKTEEAIWQEWVAFVQGMATGPGQGQVKVRPRDSKGQVIRG